MITNAVDLSVYTATITLNDDDAFEGEESFMLSIGNLTGFENVSITIFIQDNEGEFDKNKIPF